MLNFTAQWHKLRLNKSHSLIVSIGSLNALFSGNYKNTIFKDYKIVGKIPISRMELPPGI